VRIRPELDFFSKTFLSSHEKIFASDPGNFAGNLSSSYRNAGVLEFFRQKTFE
jgi:hypothetical protein